MQSEKKKRINRRKIAYVYLMHRMFEGNPTMMLKVLGIPKTMITIDELQDWNLDYKDAVYQTIEEEDSRGVELRDPNNDVPSIKSIKEKMLRRVNAVISATDDPSKLAQAYKILSDFENSDDKKEMSVIDAINESVKPLSPKKKAALTMLEKMKQEKLISGNGEKKKCGRPKKEEQKQVDPLYDDDREVENKEETEEEEE